MECNILKNSTDLCKTVVDSFYEEKVDYDIIIPEYCSSAAKIIKCEILPSIILKSIENNNLKLEILAVATVIYYDEDSGMIRSITDSTSFIQNYDIKEFVSNHRIKIKLRTSNIVCRLQNSRRISVKGLIGIATKVFGNEQFDLISEFEDCLTETKFESIEICGYSNYSQADIHIASEIQTQMPILEMLKYNSQVCINEVKVISGKAIVKGEAKIFCLYASGETVGDINSSIIAIPFSEIIEIDGAEEGDICNVTCNVSSVRCEIGNSQEQDIINAELDIVADASIFKNEKINLLKDVYSREYELTSEQQEIEIESLTGNLKFKRKLNDSVEIEIEDFVVDYCNVVPTIKSISTLNGQLIVEGDALISVYGHSIDEYKIYENNVPFKVSETFNTEVTKLRCEAEAFMINCDYNLASDNKLKVESEIMFDVLTFAKCSLPVVTDVQISSELDKKIKSKLILYYADKGENLWDIAKKYSTSVEILKRDNILESEVMENKCVLLISNK